MSAAERVSAKAAPWNVASGRGQAPLYRSRLRREEQHEKTKRAAVAFSLFLALLVAALLVGGRSFIDPLLQQQVSPDRMANRVGDIVLAMPDGKFCRHMSFDNNTAEIAEGGVHQCAVDRITGSVSRAGSFKWGAR
jgi:hypothetical protein